MILQKWVGRVEDILMYQNKKAINNTKKLIKSNINLQITYRNMQVNIRRAQLKILKIVVPEKYDWVMRTGKRLSLFI